MNLRTNLETNVIDLRRFMRSMGSLSNRLSDSAKEVLRAARVEEQENLMPRVLSSISDDLLVPARGRGGVRGRGRGRGRGQVRGRGRGLGRAPTSSINSGNY